MGRHNKPTWIRATLDRWHSWAIHYRIPAFVDLARTIKRHRNEIDTALDHGLSNALIESGSSVISVTL